MADRRGAGHALGRAPGALGGMSAGTSSASSPRHESPLHMQLPRWLFGRKSKRSGPLAIRCRLAWLNRFDQVFPVSRSFRAHHSPTPGRCRMMPAMVASPFRKQQSQLPSGVDPLTDGSSKSQFCERQKAATSRFVTPARYNGTSMSQRSRASESFRLATRLCSSARRPTTFVQCSHPSDKANPFIGRIFSSVVQKRATTLGRYFLRASMASKGSPCRPARP